MRDSTDNYSEPDSAQTQEDSDARTRLLSEAGPVFARLGYDRSTLREICRAANVNVASVGYYFGDKMGLYRAVVQQIRDARERRFPTPHNTSQADPTETLTRLIHTMLSRMVQGDESGWETQLLMREMDRPTVVFQELVNDFFRPLFQQLQSTLDRIIDGPVEKHVLEQLSLSIVGQCLYYRIGRDVVGILIPQDRRQEKFGIESLCQHITAVTLSAAKNPDFMQQRGALAPVVEKLKTNATSQDSSLTGKSASAKSKSE